MKGFWNDRWTEFYLNSPPHMIIDATMAAFPNQNVVLAIGREPSDLDPALLGDDTVDGGAGDDTVDGGGGQVALPESCDLVEQAVRVVGRGVIAAPPSGSSFPGRAPSQTCARPPRSFPSFRRPSNRRSRPVAGPRGTRERPCAPRRRRNRPRAFPPAVR